MNAPHEDGSLTIDNASVQRLLDYGFLHYTDEGFYVGSWPETNTPSRDKPPGPHAVMREALTDIRNRILCPVGPSPSLDDIQRIACDALAAAASGGDAKQAPAESPQSGPQGNAQTPSPYSRR